MTAQARPFRQSDRAELSALFRYAGEGAPTGTLWGHAESEAQVYLDPYVEREPESLFVAESDGALVGYLAGCLDTAAFPSESARMEQAMKDHRLPLRPRAMKFFARATADLLLARLRRDQLPQDFTDPRWPAHLHLNVAKAARGTGAAQELMRLWLERLDQAGVAGCHLQTLVENTRATRFFERAGFVPHGPRPRVPGIRHHGAVLHQLTMVRPGPG